MSQILYYPYINLPRTDWTLRTLLYYESVGSIVPQEYFYGPERHYEPFMLELVRSELVIPINPIEVLNNPWEATRPFISHIEENKTKIEKARDRFLRRGINPKAKIHADKFDDNIFYELEQLGLAERGEDRWYLVERKTANQLMSFLATIIGAKMNMLPTTDYIRPKYYKATFAIEQKKRETILTNLIPFPQQIDLSILRRFKERYNILLEAFRNKVELIVLNPQIEEGSRLFDEHMRELLFRKEELATKMNENHLGDILFGSVCGLIGAYNGLATADTTGAVVGGLPGFANAVHSALKIEKAENIFDQSGLKYLALADKRLRRH